MQEEKIKKCLNELINSNKNIYDYVTPKGLRDLRINICNYLKEIRNLNTNYNNVFITSGSQQSLYLLARILTNNKDKIISEEPTYFGAIEMFGELNATILTININDTGINIEKLKHILKNNNIKLIYVVPTFNNPTGICWSLNNRKEFLKVINKYNVLVIEDDPYYELNYTNKKIKTLYELNKGENIIYLGTFSKIMSPSLSVGYIVANEEIINKLYKYKLINDINTSLFIQEFINLYLTKYNIKEDIKVKIKSYKKNITIIKNKLKEFNISNIKGGLYISIYNLKNIINPSIYETNYYDSTKQDLIRINISDDPNKTLDKLFDRI